LNGQARSHHDEQVALPQVGHSQLDLLGDNQRQLLTKEDYVRLDGALTMFTDRFVPINNLIDDFFCFTLHERSEVHF
tara:strand:- start:197 stop:427 length:231 start_codon:yes stop_codon:yes gene_type:complete